MYAEEFLLFFIINFFHLFLGYGYFSLFLRHQRKKCLIFLAAWGLLWLVLNLLYYHVLSAGTPVKIISAVIIASVLLCSAIIFNLYDRIQEETDTKIREALYEHQLEYYTRQYQEISHNQEATRRMQHELKNNYILLEALAKKGDVESILAYLPQMYDSRPGKPSIHTGNMVVDAVLNHRIASARADHISFCANINIPTQLDISDIRLCGLLGNALDNAIEACMRVPEDKRCIHISMEVRKKNLFIEICNPYDGTILSDNKGHLLTRKEHSTHHGYGLSIMEELLHNNFGSMETLWDKDNFRLHIILYSVI